jgi:hypothetical protein
LPLKECSAAARGGAERLLQRAADRIDAEAKRGG